MTVGSEANPTHQPGKRPFGDHLAGLGVPHQNPSIPAAGHHGLAVGRDGARDGEAQMLPDHALTDGTGDDVNDGCAGRGRRRWEVPFSLGIVQVKAALGLLLAERHQGPTPAHIEVIGWPWQVCGLLNDECQRARRQGHPSGPLDGAGHHIASSDVLDQ